MEKEQDPYLDMTKPEERVCRICFATTTRFETPFESDLIAPCDCKGSTKWVHRAYVSRLSVFAQNYFPSTRIFSLLKLLIR
jgi:E3 ubiquitin-protein ligase DOA10